MNFEDIAKILGKAGKVVIVENGKPTYVVVPFEEYAKAPQTQEERDSSFPELLEDNGNGDDEGEEELTIDDLPV